jgi:HlyD family secretion protein
MAQQDTVRSRTWLWVALAVAAIVALLLFFRTGSQRLPVRVAEVQRHDIVRTVSTNGKVVPTVDFQAHAPTGGEIKNLFVNLNQSVTQGQLLLRMDDTQARKDVAAAQSAVIAQQNQMKIMKNGGTQDESLSARADLDAALQQQKQANNSLETMKRLQTQGAVAQNEVASAQQKLTDANAKVNQLQTRHTNRYSSGDFGVQQSQIMQAQAQLSAAQTEIAAVDIRAPFSGTVYAIPVSQYDFVTGGEALLDVADLTRLQVLAYFDEPDIGRLAIGQPVEIVWDAKPGLVWHGHILEAPTTVITYGTRNVGECLITVDDAHGDLLPNTNVTIKVTTMRRQNVLILPHEALHTEGAVNYVYRVVGDRLVKTAVQVGVVNPVSAEIVSGLKEGDKVALNATTEGDLSDGLRIKAEN